MLPNMKNTTDCLIRMSMAMIFIAILGRVSAEKAPDVSRGVSVLSEGPRCVVAGYCFSIYFHIIYYSIQRSEFMGRLTFL